MKNTMTENKRFGIFEYTDEQEYLRRRHNEGWKFVNVTGLGTYHFEKCEPQDVVYQLDYNKEGLAHKDEYVRMFEDCGWEYLMDFYGFSYFRKPAAEMNGDEEIFCDDASRLAMIDRIFKGRLLPLLILMLTIVIPYFVLSITVFKSYALFIMYLIILVVYVALFIWFGIKRGQFIDSTRK